MKIKPLNAAIMAALALAGQMAVNAAPPTVQLSDLDGTDGFALRGVETSDLSGYSVSSAGDFNGDGIDDVIIGSSDSRVADAGTVHIVFGSTDGWPAEVELSALDGTNGLAFSGRFRQTRTGRSVSTAGDLNNDGIDDLIVGAIGFIEEELYVLFGSNAGFPAQLSATDLDGVNGFRITHSEIMGRLGISVSGGGDINGDGIDDVVIGANQANSPKNNFTGAGYVLFGKNGGFPADLDLNELTSSDGFSIFGTYIRESVGQHVAVLGDINGDGFDDVGFIAPGADPDEESYAGQVFIVYGNDEALPTSFEVTDLDGMNGFAMFGDITPGAASPSLSISGLGDINGDSLDDFIFGSGGSAIDGGIRGRAYVLLGSRTRNTPLIDLQNLAPPEGIQIVPSSEISFIGGATSSAGDFNHDGFDDILITGIFNIPPASFETSSIVLFGRRSIGQGTLNLATIRDHEAVVVLGQQAGLADGVVSLTGDINGDGIDDIVLGSPEFDENDIVNIGRSHIVFGQPEIIFLDDFESTTTD